MTNSIDGWACCVDYTAPDGYCYLESVCDGDMCVDSPGPVPTPAPTPGCSAFTCGNSVCEAYFPYDPAYDEAQPGSACCCERDCQIQCTPGSTTTFPVTTTTFPGPVPTPDNSSCYMTSSIYGEPCCADPTLPPGYCYLNSACQDGICVDEEISCYITASTYGDPCCVDASLPPGYCYMDGACQNGACV